MHLAPWPWIVCLGFIVGSCASEASTMLTPDSGAGTGRLERCACDTPGATVEIVGECTWGDATMCSGFVSAVCAPDAGVEGALYPDAGSLAPDAGQVAPGPTPDAGPAMPACSTSASTEVSDGTTATGYGCTLRLVCPPIAAN